MDYKQAFHILGTEPSGNETDIRQAYRKLLTKNNPEDDPEGFKRLRRAYETALQYVRTEKSAPTQETKSETDVWMEQVKAVADLERLVERWGIRRSHPQFWHYFNDLTRYLEETEPVEAGVLDMNRYENL